MSPGPSSTAGSHADSTDSNAAAGPGPSTQLHTSQTQQSGAGAPSNAPSDPGNGDGAASASGKPELPWAFIDCPTDTLVELISHMLNLLMQHNDQVVLTPDALTRFHSRAAPGISVVDYLRRIVKYTNMEKIPLLSLLAYIDLTCSHLPTFTLSTLTVHRFLIAGVCAGSKAQCDVFCTNAHYAKVGGIKVQELNALEREFLRVTQWALCCNADLLQRYYTSLIRSHGGFTQAPSPTQSPFRPFPRSLSKPRAPTQDDVEVDEEYEGQAYGASEDGTADGEGDEVAEDDAMEGADTARGRKQRRKSVEQILGVVAETSAAPGPLVGAGQVDDVQRDEGVGGGMEVDEEGEGEGDVRVTVEHHGADVERTVSGPNGACAMHSAHSSAAASSPNTFLRPNASQTSMASPSAQTTSSYISGTTSGSASSSPRRARDAQAHGMTAADASSPASSSVPSSSRSSVRGRSRGANGANGHSPAASHRRRGSSISVASGSTASSRGSRGGGSGRGRAPSLSYSISSASGRPAEAVLDTRAAESMVASPREDEGRVRTPEIVGKRYPLEPAGAMAPPEGGGVEGGRSRTVSGSSARTETPGSVGQAHGHGPGGGRLLKNLVGVFKKRVPSGSGAGAEHDVGSAPAPHSDVTAPHHSAAASPRATSALVAPGQSHSHGTAYATQAHMQSDSSGRPLKSPRLTQSASASASRDVRMSLSLSPTTFVGGNASGATGQGDGGYMPPPPVRSGEHSQTELAQRELGQSPRSPFVGSAGSASASNGAGCGAAANGGGHGHSHVTPRVRRREQSGDGLAV